MSTSQPLVSIVTSYYNDQDFLVDAIHSVLSQTYSNIEYILINHASTDHSREIAHSFTDPRIRHIDMPINYGASGNILVKTGLNAAKGEWIKFLCADDMLLPSGIEQLLLTAQQGKGAGRQADLVFGDVNFIDVNKNSLNYTWFKNRYSIPASVEDVLKNFIQGSSTLPYAGHFIRTAALRQVKMDYVSIQMADMELWVSLLMNGANLAFLNTPVAQYRIHEGQMCSSSKLDVIQKRSMFEQLLYCQYFFTSQPSLELLHKIFPTDSIIQSLTEQDSALFPFALAHAIYTANESHAYKLAAYLKMAEQINNEELYPLIEKKCGYSIYQFRQNIVNDPIAVVDYNIHSLKAASLRELAYYFFRKIAFILLLKDWKEKRKKATVLKSEEGIV